MMLSDDPATHEDQEPSEGDSTPVQKKRHRVCPQCELNWRLSVRHEPDFCKFDDQWATLARVRKDMKMANKGQQHYFRGVHYRAACHIVEQAQQSLPMSKRARSRAKTQKCKELMEAFVAVIKCGRLFVAFSNAGRRIHVSTDLDDKVASCYNEYIADPENQEKLHALEEVELEVAKAMDYQAADGNVQILKELDHHNDLSSADENSDSGLWVFDLCRAGVAIYTSRHSCRAPIHTMFHFSSCCSLAYKHDVSADVVFIVIGWCIFFFADVLVILCVFCFFVNMRLEVARLFGVFYQVLLSVCVWWCCCCLLLSHCVHQTT